MVAEKQLYNIKLSGFRTYGRRLVRGGDEERGEDEEVGFNDAVRWHNSL